MRRLIVLLTVIVLMQDRGFARCGKERWHVKTGIDPTVGSVQLTTPTPTTIGKLVSIPRQNVDQDLPEDQRVAPVEMTLYTFKATLTGYKVEDDAKTGDSDYHLVLADESGNTMVGEIPDPHCVDGSSPFLAGITRARDAFTKVFTPTGQFQATNTPVTVSGVGFFDRVHGQRGVAPNGVELHPILDITIGISSAKSEQATTTDTTGTTSTSAAPPRAPADKTPPGTLWYVRIKSSLDTKKRTLDVMRDADVNPKGEKTTLKVTDDVAITSALKHLKPEDEAYLRVLNKDTITRVEQLPTSGAERTIPMVIIGAILLLLLYVGRRILRGADGPYSKSKFQVALWFCVLVLVYLSTCIVRWRVGGTSLFGLLDIPKNLAILSGISAFTFAAAKGIRSSKEQKAGRTPLKGEAPKPEDLPAAKKRGFWHDLFFDEEDHPDLGDAQMVIILLLAVAVYIIQVWSWQEFIPVYSPAKLPDIDTTILTAMGLGQGAYLMKKQVSS